MRNKLWLLQLGLVCVMFMAQAAMLNAQVSFAPATNYAVGNIPVNVMAADLNGDGKVDLVSANSQGNISQPSTLSVLTNNGSGVFGSNAVFNLGSGSVSVVAVDINGNGKMALISANNTASGSTLLVLTNNGSGIYGSNATLNLGPTPIALASADVNGDGKLDLICALNNGPNGITSVFTNNGYGGFGSNATYNAGTFCLSVMAADMNADGKVDFVLLGGSGPIIWTNNGIGGFGINTNINISGGVFCFTVADVNGDGKPDLISVIPSASSKLIVWTNNGVGIFSSNATYTVASSIGSITSADINGDGKLDLICAHGSTIPGTLLVMTNDGSGGFGLTTTLNVGQGVWDVIAPDVNGDGKPDLVCVNKNDNTISVLINTTTFPPPTSIPSLNIKPSGNDMLVSWPSISAGWSLQQNPDLTTTNWSSSGYSGYGIVDDGTNKSLIVTPSGNSLFRLLHP